MRINDSKTQPNNIKYMFKDSEDIFKDFKINNVDSKAELSKLNDAEYTHKFKILNINFNKLYEHDKKAVEKITIHQPPLPPPPPVIADIELQNFYNIDLDYKGNDFKITDKFKILSDFTKDNFNNYDIITLQNISPEKLKELYDYEANNIGYCIFYKDDANKADSLITLYNKKKLNFIGYNKNFKKDNNKYVHCLFTIIYNPNIMLRVINFDIKSIVDRLGNIYDFKMSNDSKIIFVNNTDDKYINSVKKDPNEKEDIMINDYIYEIVSGSIFNSDKNDGDIRNILRAKNINNFILLQSYNINKFRYNTHNDLLRLNLRSVNSYTFLSSNQYIDKLDNKDIDYNKYYDALYDAADKTIINDLDNDNVKHSILFSNYNLISEEIEFISFKNIMLNLENNINNDYIKSVLLNNYKSLFQEYNNFKKSYNDVKTTLTPDQQNYIDNITNELENFKIADIIQNINNLDITRPDIKNIFKTINNDYKIIFNKYKFDFANKLIKFTR